MIVDTSAVLAILLAEADAPFFAECIAAAESCRMSVVSFVEASIVIDRHGDAAAGRELDGFMRRSRMILEPVTLEQAHRARVAYLTFGKGRHRAGLNFGDCFAYALAKTIGEPLLFKGNDFARTDVERAKSA
jgi:ribonuclease VapC